MSVSRDPVKRQWSEKCVKRLEGVLFDYEHLLDYRNLDFLTKPWVVRLNKITLMIGVKNSRLAYDASGLSQTRLRQGHKSRRVKIKDLPPGDQS